MKTAMQTLLNDIEFLMPRTYKVLSKKFQLESFHLEKEKQQIIEAYEKDMDSNGNLSFESGEQYYNETFS